MGRFHDAWLALTGRSAALALSPAQTVALAKGLEDGFGLKADTRQTEAILGGIFPYGQPPARGTRELLALYAASPWLRIVLGGISHDVSQTEWEAAAFQPAALRSAPFGQRSAASHTLQHGSWEVRRKAARLARRASELVPLESHPLLDFLRHGNDVIDGTTGLAVTQLHLDLKGEAYWLIERDGPGGKPVRWYALPPHWVIATPSFAIPFFRIQNESLTLTVPREDVVWFRDVDAVQPFGRGTGRGQALSDELQADEWASKHVGSFFFNRGLPAAIVSMEGADQKEAERIKHDWEGRYTGAFKAFRTHFTGRKVSVAQLSQSFEDMQLIELRRFERDAVFETYGWPKELAGILDNANRSTIDTADFRAQRYVIRPRREVLRAQLQKQLAPEWDERIALDYVDTVPADREFQLRVVTARGSAFTEDEVRELAGLEPLPDGEGEERPPLAGSMPPASPFGMGLGHEPEFVKHLRGRRTKAEEEEEDLDQGPPAALSDDDIEAVASSIKTSPLTKLVNDVMKDDLRKFLDEQAEATGMAGGFDVINPILLEQVEHTSDRISEVDDTTKDFVRAALRQGLEEGESIRELRNRIKSIPGFDPSSRRADVIARTEQNRAANAGTLAVYDANDLVVGKQWVATTDSRTRDTHRALNGVVVAKGADFKTASGATCACPGSFGTAAEDINCRCTTVAVLDDEFDPKSAKAKPKDLALISKRFIKRGDPWIERLRAAAAAGFAEQLDAALAELDQRAA